MASSTTPPSAPTLTCKDCGYVNEPERVYCHNCGAKLDRSVLPKEEEIRREPPERARKRIMRMANPPSVTIRRTIMALAKTLLFAALVAGVYQASRAPDDVPPQRSETLARPLGSELTDLATSPVPRSTTYTEADVNAFLKTGKVKSAGNIPGVEFKRMFVNFTPGAARLTSEKTVAGRLPFYVGTLYRVQGGSGVLTATNTGGNIGRLPIHPLLMERLSPMLFGTIFESLKREMTVLQQMQSVTVQKGSAVVVSRGKP